MVYFSNSFIMKLQIDDDDDRHNKGWGTILVVIFVVIFVVIERLRKGLIVVQRAVPNDSIVLLILDKTSQNSSSFVTVFPREKVKYNNLFLFTGNSQLCMMQRNGEKMCSFVSGPSIKHQVTLFHWRLKEFPGLNCLKSSSQALKIIWSIWSNWSKLDDTSASKKDSVENSLAL